MTRKSVTNHATSDDWAKQQSKNLFQLLENHGLDRTDPLCWVKLSIILAQDYVPGFLPARPTLKRRGRPRKKVGVLSRFLKEAEQKKGRGRPRELTEADEIDFIELVEGEKALLKQKGVRNPTDKAALESFLRDHAQRNGKRRTVSKKDVHQWETRLTRARKNQSQKSK